jgi:N-acetylmuramoyl-L-alanine amidase CwlA
MAINIVKQTSYNNISSTPNRTIKYIVVHYTAGTTSRAGSARNTALFFSNYGVNASADFITDDSTIVQFNPDLKNYSCWHCGDSKNYNKGGSFYGKCTNFNSIGIEVCSTNNTGTMTQANDTHYSFTDAVVNKTVELVKYLMKTYNIPASNVIRHYDVTGKWCPGIRGWNNEANSDSSKWKAFKARLGGTTTTTATTQTTTSKETIYRVRKSANDAATQIGAWKNLASAKDQANKNAAKGYKVYDSNGKLVYEPKTTTTTNTGFKSYTAVVTADVLNVRKGPGTNYGIATTIRKNEVYTIVEEKSGWGLLKAYKAGRNGWVSLNYMKKK